LLRHGTVLYLATTPWLIAFELEWWAPPVMALLAYFLLGIEWTAEDVEEPFGSDRDDLMLGTYCETIRKSADEILADPTGAAITDSPR
jgi:putative membrane protein